jgi:hypothetical protein
MITNFKIGFTTQDHSLSNMFIRRTDEIIQISQKLLPIEPLKERIFVIVGLRGIRKSQLATKYIEKYHDIYNVVFWVDRSTKYLYRQ